MACGAGDPADAGGVAAIVPLQHVHGGVRKDVTFEAREMIVVQRELGIIPHCVVVNLISWPTSKIVQWVDDEPVPEQGLHTEHKIRRGRFLDVAHSA